MSFLLDALRKSELERKVGEDSKFYPELMYSGAPTKRSHEKILIGALVFINLGALIYIVWDNQAESAAKSSALRSNLASKYEPGAIKSDYGPYEAPGKQKRAVSNRGLDSRTTENKRLPSSPEKIQKTDRRLIRSSEPKVNPQRSSDTIDILTVKRPSSKPSTGALATKEPASNPPAAREPSNQTFAAKEPSTKIATEKSFGQTFTSRPAGKPAAVREPSSQPFAVKEPSPKRAAKESFGQTSTTKEPASTPSPAGQTSSESFAVKDASAKPRVTKESVRQSFGAKESSGNPSLARAHSNQSLAAKEVSSKPLVTKEALNQAFSAKDSANKSAAAREPLSQTFAAKEPSTKVATTESFGQAFTAKEPTGKPDDTSKPSSQTFSAKEPSTKPLATQESFNQSFTAKGLTTRPLATATNEPLNSPVNPQNPDSASIVALRQDLYSAVKSLKTKQANNDKNGSAKKTYPLLSELPVKFQRELPTLKINLFVYSNDPDDRFVLVNMSRYVTGQKIEDGPQIMEIRPDSLALSYRGQNFRILRP